MYLQMSQVPVHFSQCVKVEVLVAQLCLTLQPHGLWPARLLFPWNSPKQECWSGSHSLLQEVFLTQRSNPGLLYWGQVLYCLKPQSKNICIVYVEDFSYLKVTLLLCLSEKISADELRNLFQLNATLLWTEDLLHHSQ